MSFIRLSFSQAVSSSMILILFLAGLDVWTGAIYVLAYELYFALGIFISGLTPIVLFYLGLRSRITAGIGVPSDSEIDSMYYLGFLVTLVTLIGTVASTSLSTLEHQQAESVIGNQSVLVSVSLAFALSLAATALALFFRIELAGLKERNLTDLSTDALESRVTDMILQVDISYAKLCSVIANMVREMEELPKTHSANVAAELRVITLSVQEELSKVMSALSQEISSSGLSESLLGVTSSFKRGGSEISEIVKSLGPIPRRVSAISSKLDEVDSEALGLRNRIMDIQAKAGAVDGSIGQVPVDMIVESSRRLIENVNYLGDALKKSEVLVSSGSGVSSASALALSDASRQLEDASVVLGRSFVALSAELTKTAEFLVRELRDQTG